MKTAMKVLLGLTMVFAALVVAQAEEKEAKTEVLKGEILCTKCALGETKACGNAIKVKIDDKDVVIYFKDKAGKAPYHGDICGGPKKGTVTGVVVTEKGKKYVTPAKDGVKFDE